MWRLNNKTYPEPNDVMPAKYHRPSFKLHWSGPPESPMQVPAPPSVIGPAQMWYLLIGMLYIVL